jgi:hypothetical protein
MDNGLYAYLIGLSMLAHGSISFMKKLKPYDKRSLQYLLAIGNFFTFIFFVAGFFIYQWYVPIIAAIVLHLVYEKISNDFFRYNLFFAIKDQLFIVIGIFITAYSMFIFIFRE